MCLYYTKKAFPPIFSSNSLRHLLSLIYFHVIVKGLKVFK